MNSHQRATSAHQPVPGPGAGLCFGPFAKPDLVPSIAAPLLLPPKASGPTARKDRDVVMYRRLYGVEAKGRRLSMVPGSYIKDISGKPGKGRASAPDASTGRPR